MGSSAPKPPFISQDTIVALSAVAIGSALAWWWLFVWHAGMPMDVNAGMHGMSPASWTAPHALAVFVMWTIMMVAMMLPSATPMILLHARTAKQSKASTVAFAAAYLAVWTGFSAVATLAQWMLSEVGWLNDAMQINRKELSAVLLAGAGLYQLTPLKQICLHHCRSPLSYLMQHWRPGFGGAIRMGLSHGAYCVGCCWFMMSLLFVGGIMNLAWIVVLTIFVMAERLFPFGEIVGKVAGALAIAAAVMKLMGVI